MAFPVPAAQGNYSSSSALQSHAVDLSPLGTIAAGDGLLLVVAVDGGDAITSWGSFTEVMQEEPHTSIRLGIAYRHATGGDADPTIQTAGNEKIAVRMFRFSNADVDFSVDPPTANANADTASPNNNPDPPSHTPGGGAKDYRWIAASAQDDDEDYTGYPSDMSNGGFARASGSGGTSCATAERSLNAASYEPTGTFTFTGGAENWATNTVAVWPVSAVIFVEFVSATGAGVGDGTGSGDYLSEFDGSAAGVGSGSGTAGLLADMVSSGSGTGDGSGTAGLLADFSSSGDGIGDGSAILNVLYGLVAAGDGVGSGDGTFGVLAPAEFDADSTGIGDGSGTFNALYTFGSTSGTGIGTGNATGDVLVALIGSGSGVGIGVGSFSAILDGSATSIGVGTGSGTFSFVGDYLFAAPGLGTGAGSATFSALLGFDAAGEGVGTGVGAPEVIFDLSGSSTGLGSATGLFDVFYDMTAATDPAVVTGVGTMDVLYELDADSVGDGTGSGTFGIVGGAIEMQAAGIGIGFGMPIGAIGAFGLQDFVPSAFHDARFRLRRTDTGSTLQGGDTLQGVEGMAGYGLGEGVSTGTLTLTTGDMVASGTGVGTGQIETTLVVTILQPDDGASVGGVIEIQVEIDPYVPLATITLEFSNNPGYLIRIDRTSGPGGLVWTYDWDTTGLTGSVDIEAVAWYAATPMGSRQMSQDPIGGFSFTEPDWIDTNTVTTIGSLFLASGTGVGTGSGSLFGVVELGIAQGIGLGIGSGTLFGVVVMQPAVGVGVGTGTVEVTVDYRRGGVIGVEKPGSVVYDEEIPSVTVDEPDTIEPDQELVLVEVADG